jgi:acyl carrier protein
MMQKMFDVASKVVTEQLNIPLERITADTTFYDLEADYLDVVEIIMALEDIYDVEFPVYDPEYYPTLDALIAVFYDCVQKVRK